ncbi:glycosyltransferase family 2 protein [Joostella atrarenae]|uniref:Glycosyltransferase family 2 protein n=1 Tax=Joostella atrarenae TaxID=679257 RepID=A0ABS9J3A3_9FLAO|nr:glycosyltransferase family 2 protein [Joostella atrarenae]MCF8714889.1 glycosyltransferase family 2 protein [Joostella atrarenae]
MNKSPLVHIIILNWNSPEDTIDCLRSLSKIEYRNFKVVLIDNASGDNSVQEITTYLSNDEYYLNYGKIDLGLNLERSTSDRDYLKHEKLVMVLNKENSGFAKGSNIGIELAINEDCDYVLLLNNDTVVEPNFLNVLLKHKLENPEYAALTPQIRYEGRKDYIWNCGGRLILWGFWKKYYYDNTNINTIEEEKDLKLITFVTGCALLFNPNELGKLTEDYFFGEEDFEFSLRLRNMNKKMGCAMNSLIYHKVGGSLEDVNAKGKRYIHLLNRFINTRKNNMNVSWFFLVVVALNYNFIYLIIKEKMSLVNASKFTYNLFLDALRLNRVTHKKFINTIFKHKW